ncbi:hypothetical protein BH10ACI2_BH10ACI2_18390 [soil metagenome]
MSTGPSNRARSGGGIAFQASEESSSFVEGCLINSNTASGQGGGIYIAAGMYPRIKGSTITNNTAITGGGIANYGGPILANDTIARNSASQSSSSFLTGAGTRADILNSIIGPDIGQTVTSVEGSFSSLGSNIVTNSTGSTGWGWPGDQISTNNAIDPKIGNLADNGGHTDTVALLPGSPAIDKGDDCATPPFSCVGGIAHDLESNRDQRKFSRLTGSHIDIGAFEAASSPNLNTTTTNMAFAVTRRIAFSRVTVINTETMERKFSFIALLPDRNGSTPPVIVQRNVVYVAEIQTKRSLGTHKLVIYEF